MPRLLDDFSASERVDFLIRRDGLVVDTTFKAWVSPLFPPRKNVFAVTEMPTPFKERLHKHGQLYIVVEHPRSSEGFKPEYVKVKEIDYRTFVLEGNGLNYAPRPGANVGLLVAVERKLIDERVLDDLQKQELIWV